MITILAINFTMPFVQQPYISAYCVMLCAYIISGFFLSCFDYSALSILQAFMVSKELGLTVNIPETLQKFLELEENNQHKTNVVEMY